MRYGLPGAALVLLGTAVPALADPSAKLNHAVYGCVDPRATTALAIPDGRLHNRKWVDYVHRTGQCTLLPAGHTYGVLTRHGALSLVRASGNESAPPVYVQSSDLTEIASAPEPAAPGADAAKIETAPSLAPKEDAPSPQSMPEPAHPAAPVEPVPASPPVSDRTTPPSASATAPVPAAPAVRPPIDQAAPAETSSAPLQSPPQSTAGIPPVPAAPPQAEPKAAPAPAPTPDMAKAPEPVKTPEPVKVEEPAQRHSSGMPWLLLLVLLALLGLIAAAVAIARQQRRFAHVEDKDWPDEHNRSAAQTGVIRTRDGLESEPSPQEYRRRCVETLERGGWIIQPSFAAGATREGAPDILGRKRDAILAVRCISGHATITPEIVEDVATMGRDVRAHVVVLASPAPMSRRAHDEAMRLHIHVLDQEELGSLSA